MSLMTATEKLKTIEPTIKNYRLRLKIVDNLAEIVFVLLLLFLAPLSIAVAVQLPDADGRIYLLACILPTVLSVGIAAIADTIRSTYIKSDPLLTPSEMALFAPVLTAKERERWHRYVSNDKLTRSDAFEVYERLRREMSQEIIEMTNSRNKALLSKD